MLPVILNITNKKILVIGGGKVSERRVKKFFDAGGKVTVISKSFTPTLQELSEQKKIKLISEKITERNVKNWLENAFLISIATNDPELNLKIANIAKTKGILVNISQKNAISDILIPAYFEKDDILVVISTKGKSPQLAKQLKNKILKFISDEDILWLKVQNYARTKIYSVLENQKEREQFLKNLEVNKTIQDFIIKNDINGALDIVNNLISKIKK